MEFVVHRTNNSLHSTLNCLHTRFERPRFLLGIAIDVQEAKGSIYCRNLDKFKILEAFFLSCNLVTKAEK